VNGVSRTGFDPDSPQIELHASDMGRQVVVEFCPKRARGGAVAPAS
jgi:hypothetical protein